MRTTIRIDEQLLKQARQLALRRNQSLSAVIEDALCEMLARQAGHGERPPVHLPTFRGKGTLPGVDLDDSAALLDRTDAGHDPD